MSSLCPTETKKAKLNRNSWVKTTANPVKSLKPPSSFNIWLQFLKSCSIKMFGKQKKREINVQRKHESAKIKLPRASRRHDVNTYQESASDKSWGETWPTFFHSVESLLSSSRLMLQASIKRAGSSAVCYSLKNVFGLYSHGQKDTHPTVSQDWTSKAVLCRWPMIFSIYMKWLQLGLWRMAMTWRKSSHYSCALRLWCTACAYAEGRDMISDDTMFPFD